MRALKLTVIALLIMVGLPVVIVGILGMILSPFQTVARATEPQDMMQVSDLMLSEAVEEHVQQTLAERAMSAEPAKRAEAKGTVAMERADAANTMGHPGAVESAEEAKGLDAATLDDAAESAVNSKVISASDASDATGINASSYEEPIAGGSQKDDGVDTQPYEESTAGYLQENAGTDVHPYEESATGYSQENIAESDSQTSADSDTSSSGESVACEASAQSSYYSSEQLRNAGIISDGGVSYTWYSERVLPGGGLGIEGRHVSDEGYVVDGQGRIVVASSDLPYGTELSVPFGNGTAVVLDTGCAPGIVDIYTNF